ncbi:MAG: SMI1/KNR4 family protein [Oscillospiraceae bacterium]|nr:SMI1/KNR4 family protein [Oscillospiraceae bacterium]MBQ8808187.1 SMI1/KNR4 family protein [Clostridia bacterium]
MLISKYGNNNTENRINEIEKKFNITLPSQYRNFLCKYNGGDTPDTTYKVGKASSALRAFYGFGSIRYSLDKLNIQEWIEKNMFPIACDHFGNEIVISLEEISYGNIYFCDHEDGFKAQLVGDDFKTFVSKCKSKKINPACSTPIAQREADLIARGRGHVITDTLRKTWQAEIDKYGNMVQERVILK